MQTETKPTHTPTPWKLQPNHGIADILEGNKWVAGGVEINRAARIVRAVNAHQGLVAAIKNAIANMKAANPLYLTVATMHGEVEALTDGIAFLEEALAKAEGKE